MSQVRILNKINRQMKCRLVIVSDHLSTFSLHSSSSYLRKKTLKVAKENDFFFFFLNEPH